MAVSTTTVPAERVEPPVILAIDVGTSSVRALLFDRWGRAVEGGTARRTYQLQVTTDGAVEADPEAMLDRVWSCVDEVLQTRGGELRAAIGGVAVCTFVSNVLGVDQQGRAVTPLITYADTRSARDVAWLREATDERAVHQRTGCRFHTSYLPARFRWLARSRPALFEQVERWISIGEYVELQLFGETAVSYSVASWTGLLNRRRLTWDEPLLALLPVGEEQLSPLTDVDVPRRGLRRPFADRWPALQDVPWFPAVGDGATANVGSGCTTPARVALSMGTTSAVRLVTDREVERVPKGLWCYRVDGHRSLPGGALSEGGNVFAWMRKVLKLGDPSDLDAALAGTEPDAHGLTVLPFLTGERSPGWAGDARGTLHGLSLATTPIDILRASMEAVAYRVGLVFDLMQPLLPEDFQVVASGGALLNSPPWLQIVADVLGRPLAVSQVEEASARGAALLALEALGVLDDVSEAPPFVGESVTPDEGAQEQYREAMERQRRLYEKLIEGSGR